MPVPGEWVQAGTGVRLATELGAHRKRPSKESSLVEDELWKRCFWYVSLLHTRFVVGPNLHYIQGLDVVQCMQERDQRSSVYAHP